MNLFRVVQVPNDIGHTSIPGQWYITDAIGLTKFLDAEANGDAGNKFMIEVMVAKEVAVKGE